MGNDERPKVSWRDIDKRRDGSGGGRSAPGSSSGERPRAGTGMSSHEEHRQKQYRAALEAAFAKGELGKLADKLNIPGLGPGSSPAPAVAADRERETAEASASPDASGSPASSGPAHVEADSGAGGKKNGGRKKVEDERLTLRRKLVEAAGRQEISRAAEKYLARYPLPDDHELLEQLLEHERESRIREAIDRIRALIERRQPPRRSRALCGKLRYIIETSPDNDLRQAAEGLLDRLA